jgi:hypothetical protein
MVRSDGHRFNFLGRELAFFPAPLLKLTLRGVPPGPCPRALPLGPGKGTFKVWWVVLSCCDEM